MVTNDQIMTTIQDCAKKGHIVNARDIAYAILCMHFEDSLVAFKAIFRNDSDYNEEYHNTYDNSSASEEGRNPPYRAAVLELHRSL